MSKKIFEKFFWVKNFFVSTLFLGQKNFGSKKFLGRKNFWLEKRFWVKKIWVRNFFVLKTGRVNPRGRIYDFPPENRRVKFW